MPVPAAFMSYVRFDDQYNNGWLTRFREQLSNEIRAQTGSDFAIFQDRNDIAWGQNWQQRIDEALDTVTLLLVIITPSLFRSSACRDEVNKFLERERALGRQDLILPVYYITAREMEDPALRQSDDLAKVLASRQLADLRQLRSDRITSQRAQRTIAQLASRMRDTFWQHPVTPVPLPSGCGQPSESSAKPTKHTVNADQVTAQPDLQSLVIPAYRPQRDPAATSSGEDVREVSVAGKLDGHVTGVGNVELYWQGWLPKGRVTGVVLLCHGAGEHAGRYQNVVDALTPDGWAVYGVDHRGHGQSTGERVHVERFSDWIYDFDLFRREVTGRHRNLPVFLLGHSLGAQIALAYAVDHQQDLRGLVLSAPYLAAMTVPQVVQPAAKLAARFLPRARFKLVDLDKISKDPDVVRRYRSDPHVWQGNATLAMANIVAAQFDVLIERSRSLRIPVLIQHGTDDAIADPNGSRRLYDAYGSPDKTFLPYPALWHEIYNEPERQRPLADLRKWLTDHRLARRLLRAGHRLGLQFR